jgi:hypothetical protein
VASWCITSSPISLKVGLLEVYLSGIVVAVMGLRDSRRTRSRGLSKVRSDPEVVLPWIRLDRRGFQLSDPILVPSYVFCNSSGFSSSNNVFSHPDEDFTRYVVYPEEDAFFKASV